jgi:hypothetical protein
MRLKFTPAGDLVWGHYIVALSADTGEALGAMTWGNTGIDKGDGIAIASDGSIFLAATAETVPPYIFDPAPTKTSRLRGASRYRLELSPASPECWGIQWGAWRPPLHPTCSALPWEAQVQRLHLLSACSAAAERRCITSANWEYKKDHW